MNANLSHTDYGSNYDYPVAFFNLLKPSGNFTYDQV
jgi:hypothetical protein